MKKIISALKNDLPLLLLCGFFIFALFNPVFKKYDYGAGFPLIALFALVILIILILDFRKIDNELKRSVFDKLFLLIFGLTYLIAFIFSQTKNISLPETAAYLSMIPLYFYLARRQIPWEEKFYSFLTYIVYSAVAVGYLQFLFMEAKRMTGPFFNILDRTNFWANGFAMFLLLAWPVLLISASKKKELKWYDYFGFSFVLSGLLLSFSRGAIIAFIGQLVILIILKRKSITIKKIKEFVVIVIISALLFFAGNFVRSFTAPTIDISDRILFSNDLSSSFQERIDFMMGAVDLSLQNPLVGMGPFSFRYAYEPNQKTFLGSADHPHNIFLKFSSENGIPNMLAFVLFLLSIGFLAVIRFKQIDEKKRFKVIILSIGILGVLAHSLIDYNLNFFASLLLFFIFLALIKSNLILKNDAPAKKCYFPLILTLLLFATLTYEMGLLIGPHIGIGKDLLNYRLYPRYSYLENGETLIDKNNFAQALDTINLQIQLNPLDSTGYYLKGLVYCENDYERKNLSECKKYIKDALDLNPMNNIAYYRDYLSVMQEMGLTMNNKEYENFFNECLSVLNNYFSLVKYNAHFTAYSDMVEAAAELVELMIPELNAVDAAALQKQKQLMLEYAEMHRAGLEVSVH